MSTSLWQTIGRRNQIVVGVGAACLVAVAASGGCYAHRVPVAGQLPADAQLLAAAPLPFTVSIAAWNADAGADAGRSREETAALAALVAGSRAFKASRLADAKGAEADLIAIPLGLHCETSVVPVFSILTAGIIPTVFEAERCDGFILRSSKAGSAPPIEIRVRAKEQVIAGWAAVVLGALRGWAYGGLDADRRYADLIRLEVARRKTEIDALVKSAPPPAEAPPADGTPQPPNGGRTDSKDTR